MASPNIKFSILIPAYKATFLKECIDSILCQTYDDFELLILNDNSPEDIEGIVNGFDDNRIRYFENQTNVGVYNLVNNWNGLLDLSSGQYVICMGDDDRLLPNCLSEYTKLIAKFPDLDIYHGQTEIIDQNGTVIEALDPRPAVESVFQMIAGMLRGRREYVGDYCYRASTLKEMGGFYFLPAAWYSDHITAFMACDGKGIANTESVIFQYRRSDLTITSGSNTEYKLDATCKSEIWLSKFLRQYTPSTSEDISSYNFIINYYRKFFNSRKFNLVSLDLRSNGISKWHYWCKKSRLYDLSPFDMVHLMISYAKWKAEHR